MRSYVALFREGSSTSDMIALSANPGIVHRFAKAVLEDEDGLSQPGPVTGDPIVDAIRDGRRAALSLIAEPDEALSHHAGPRLLEHEDDGPPQPDRSP